MKIIFFSAISLLIISCNNKNGQQKSDIVKYQNGRQLLSVNDMALGKDITEPRIGRISEDSVLKGQELLARIYLQDGRTKIVEAYVACDSVANPSVDTTTYEVSGCAKRLLVENDTILIGFRPSEVGRQRFPKITILTVDDERIFRTLHYSFEYEVVF